MKQLLQRLIILTAFTLAVTSCNTLKESADPRHAASFQSYPNGVADIRLEIKEDARFVYRMEIYPEPENVRGDTLTEHLAFKGRWGNDEEDYVLRFRRRNKPDLYALFNPGYDPSTHIEVTDERTIRFPLKDREIVIWGIRCFKEDGE